MTTHQSIWVRHEITQNTLASLCVSAKKLIPLCSQAMTRSTHCSHFEVFQYFSKHECEADGWCEQMTSLLASFLSYLHLSASFQLQFITQSDTSKLILYTDTDCYQDFIRPTSHCVTYNKPAVLLLPHMV